MLHRVLGVLDGILGVPHRILGVPRRVLGVPHRILGVSDGILGEGEGDGADCPREGTRDLRVTSHAQPWASIACMPLHDPPSLSCHSLLLPPDASPLFSLRFSCHT